MNDSIEATRPSEPAPAAVAANQTLIQNRITVVVPPAPRAAAPARPKPAPVAPATPVVQGPLPQTLPSPEYYYDANGVVKFTRFTDAAGNTAVLREDPTEHNHVTLTLTDKKGALVTNGDARGFEKKTLGSTQSTSNWYVVRDTLNCPSGSQSIRVNETESVTRDKLQQFAEDHPQLASALRKVELPVTVMGGLPVTFAKAVDTPTEFRACPENRPGIILERLTEKSAKR